jgi:hypothetical protein
MPTISIKVIAYGVPALLILLGWITLVLSNEFLQGLTGYGSLMVGVGILLYVVELLLSVIGIRF